MSIHFLPLKSENEKGKIKKKKNRNDTSNPSSREATLQEDPEFKDRLERGPVSHTRKS